MGVMTSLTTISGFSALTRTGGFSIDNNDRLTSVSGFDVLGTAGGITIGRSEH